MPRRTHNSSSSSSSSHSHTHDYPPNRAWIFTWNNFTDINQPKEWQGDYCVWQHERGENGVNHLQGYIYFKQPRTFRQIKNLNRRCHWEPREGTHEQAELYNSKPETRIEGPFRYGTPPQQGKRNDLVNLKKDIDDGMTNIKDIADKHFNFYLRYQKGIISYLNMKMYPRSQKTIVTVIYGPSNVGKSFSIRQAFPDAYWFTKPTGKNSPLWFDGYNNQETVVFDEFYGWIPFDSFLRLCDAYPYNVEIKGSTIPFTSKRIFITSNKPPTQWYTNITDQVHITAFWRRIEVVFHKTCRTKYILEKDKDIHSDEEVEFEFPVAYGDKYINESFD